MSDSILSAPYFHNEEAADEFVEARIWPRGPVCPHCGGVVRNSRMGGKSTRIGVCKREESIPSLDEHLMVEHYSFLPGRGLSGRAR